MRILQNNDCIQNYFLGLYKDMINYSNLAQKIINTNDQQAYSLMLNAICQPQNLERLLNQIPQSDVLHFIFTQLLSKSIINGQFCPINQTKSDDNNTKQNSNQKAKLYSMIVPRLFNNLVVMNFDKKQQHILKSVLNSISVCLKDLCDNNKNLPIFTNILTNTLFPNFKINEYFTSSLNGELIFLQPSQAIFVFFMSNQKALDIYKYSAKILIELIEYITMVTVYKTYYEYRRNIYTFRNTYLSSILNVATQYHKFLHLEWKKNQSNHQLINALTVSISLLEKIFTYPFSLTLHEFQSEEQNKDNAIGINSEIYFPNFYRNVLCDTSFLDSIFEFYLFLMSQLNSVNQLGQTVYALIRILGRIISASIYTFNTEQQRKTFRSYCTSITISLLYNFKFFDCFYIETLSQIFCKVLISYTSVDLQQKRQKLFQGLIFFSQALINNCQIKLQDGKRNPFNKAFDILVNCLNETKQTMYSDLVIAKSQEILNKAFLKLYLPQVADRIIKDFGKNQKNEIQCFQQLFEHIPVVFAVDLQKNLSTLNQLEIQRFGQSQQTIWLHLCAILLPNHLANRDQTVIILKYFKVAKQGNTLACLHYIKILVNQVIHEMDNGVPNTPLWTYIQEIQNCSFTDFMLYIIRVCKKNFQQFNTDIIDYALQVFKSIYMKLRKHSNQITIQNRFDPFYDQVKQLISNMSSTVFENQKFYKRRVQLFSVISTIWINSDNFKYLQEIYSLVSTDIRKQIQQQNPKVNPLTLLKYMNDIRGLLQPIENCQSFKIVCELSMMDLQKVFALVFSNSQTIRNFFSEQIFLKAFCKMILQFATDYSRRLTYHVQTDLPFMIYDLFKPYLLQILKYDYPKCTVLIWIKFCTLNPLQQMLPLVPSFKQKEQKEFPTLIREYFQNIHRVQLSQLQSLYSYIQDKVQFLSLWWQQVIRRKLQPNVSLYEVVESRIASTKRQKQQLAKLIYYVGSYNKKYWNIDQWSDERQFVKWFLQNYKGWKE